MTPEFEEPEPKPADWVGGGSAGLVGSVEVCRRTFAGLTAPPLPLGGVPVVVLCPDVMGNVVEPE